MGLFEMKEAYRELKRKLRETEDIETVKKLAWEVAKTEAEIRGLNTYGLFTDLLDQAGADYETDDYGDEIAIRVKWKGHTYVLRFDTLGDLFDFEVFEEEELPPLP